MEMKRDHIAIDPAGRIVIPKPIRERLGLQAGDTLEFEVAGDQINLRPVKSRTSLAKEHGIWVYQGQPADASLTDLIDRERDNRFRGFVR